jgi:hypothetical protein
MTAEARRALKERMDLAVRLAVRWDAVDRCTGCGGELRDDFGRRLYVLGCDACRDRRSMAAHRERHTATRPTFSRGDGRCVGCGVALFLYDEGCGVCRDRRAARGRRAQARRAEAQLVPQVAA